jgi:hypothetical protein
MQKRSVIFVLLATAAALTYLAEELSLQAADSTPARTTSTASATASTGAINLGKQATGVKGE